MTDTPSCGIVTGGRMVNDAWCIVVKPESLSPEQLFVRHDTYLALQSKLATLERELAEARKDAELGRYIRLTAEQRQYGLSEYAFSIRIEDAIKRRAAIDAVKDGVK